MKKLLAVCALGAASLCAQAPSIYSGDGEWKYLGRLSSNTLDPDSISNPLGRYGSPLSPDSVNNPLGRYGSPLSPSSARNPLATQAPIIMDDYGYGRRMSTTPQMPAMRTRPYRSTYPSWR